MVRFGVAFLGLLVLAGCSSTMTSAEAGDRALYLFCTANRINAEVVDAFLQQDFDNFKLSTAAREDIYREQYEAFVSSDQWPAEVRPEIQELAQLTLVVLDNESRVRESLEEAVTFEDAVIAIGSTSTGIDEAVTSRINELSTAVRVKLNLSLDRESSCVGY